MRNDLPKVHLERVSSVICTYICTHIRVYIYMCVYMCVYLYRLHMYVYIDMYVCVYVCVCACVYVIADFVFNVYLKEGRSTGPKEDYFLHHSLVVWI